MSNMTEEDRRYYLVADGRVSRCSDAHDLSVRSWIKYQGVDVCAFSLDLIDKDRVRVVKILVVKCKRRADGDI